MLPSRDVCSEKSFLGSVRSIRSVLPCCAGQSHGEQPGLGAWRVGMRAEPPDWAALRSQWHCRALSCCLASLPCLLFPAQGKCLGHYSAAALPRKLGRLGFIALGAVGVQGRSQPSPQIMMTKKQVYCVLTEISPPIFPSLARSSSSLAFIFLTQM